MRISLNWLRDFLDIKSDVDIAQISNSLTLAGLEVEAVEVIREKAAGLFLGQIDAITPRAQGDSSYSLLAHGKKITAIGPRLAWLTPGMWVAYARDPKNYRVADFTDLGLDIGALEPIAFEANYFSEEVPEELSSVKDFDDVVFTLGITPNRADALSHLGVSRELSAILDLNPRVPMVSPKEMAGPIHEKVVVEISDDNDCPRYACRLLENVTVAKSPLWLRLRLAEVGIRPINNVVDVTNYVMISRGQPLHAFDFDQLSKDNTRAKIVVRRGFEGEKFAALNGQEYTLAPSDIVIADVEKPLALAGAIGGASSAVTDQTTTVLLEAAYFDPKIVRMSARRQGLITETSYRFERGVDPNGVIDALNFAARLLTEVADVKVCREAIDAYRKRIDPQEIKMRPERAQAVLGIDAQDFDQDILRRRFLRLGIETVAKRGDAIYFLVPTHRSDLTREIDLIEEAARMIGYDKVKETCLNNVARHCELVDEKQFNLGLKMRELLKGRGFFEAINYAFLQKDWHAHFLAPEGAEKLIPVKNPLSDRYGVMRSSLIPGLVRNLLHNQRNQEKSVSLFEIGNVFLGLNEQGRAPAPESLTSKLNQDSFAIEKPLLAGVMSGRSTFYAFDRPAANFDFYCLKGVLTEILLALGFSDQFPDARIEFSHGTDAPYLHPGESSMIRYRADNGAMVALGHFGKLHPAIAASVDVHKDSFVFELDLEAIMLSMSSYKRFKPFSRFPTIERDVAFLVNEDVRVGDILAQATALEHAAEQLVNARVFDIYRGKNLGEGKKSVAIALALQRNDRTLTDEEADAFVKNFMAAVESATGAQIR